MSDAQAAELTLPDPGPAATHAGNSFRDLVRNRNFSLLWLGQSASLLGDQLYMIALPWLVLQLTGDPLALGAVLALAGVPRALFIVVGGAITDRFSPRTVMLISDLLRLALTALLALIVAAGWTQMWMLYAIALAFGLISGFFMPAAGAILPGLVRTDELASANALTAGTAQISGFAGPLLAGGLIALGAGRGGASTATAGTQGIALAFAIDALSFVASVVTLWLMRVDRTPTGPGAPQGAAPFAALVRSVREGFSYFWAIPIYRLTLVLIAAINFLLSGPFIVGVPVLAKARLPEGAAAFAIIVAAFSLGNLLGFVVAGSVKVKRMGRVLPAVFGLFGLGMLAFSWLSSTPAAFLVVFVMGLGNGYVGISMMTWLQKRTPPEMMGRMTSLILVANVGLLPISQALSGAIVSLSIPALFAAAGALILATALAAARSPDMQALEL